MPQHASPHFLAGHDTRIVSGVFEHRDVTVIDWFDRVSGRSWRRATADEAAHAYGFRAAYARLPCDDEVVLGILSQGPALLHDSELPEARVSLELRP